MRTGASAERGPRPRRSVLPSGGPPRASYRRILRVDVVCSLVGAFPFSIELKQDQDLTAHRCTSHLSRLLFWPFPAAGRSETASAGWVRFSGQIWFVSGKAITGASRWEINLLKGDFYRSRRFCYVWTARFEWVSSRGREKMSGVISESPRNFTPDEHDTNDSSNRREWNYLQVHTITGCSVRWHEAKVAWNVTILCWKNVKRCVCG